MAPEHDVRRLPDVIEICTRCKRGIVVFLGTGDEHPYTPDPVNRPTGWCYVCGFKGRGDPYRRISFDVRESS